MSNVNFYICRRFFTKDFPNYRGNNNIEEIISVDCALFPYNERKTFDEKTALAENEQILAVFILENVKKRPALAGFAFCGYDLAEAQTEISALTNCPHFSDAISASGRLNPYGLFDKRKDAERLQKLLPEYYPNEEHANCEIYGIWRRLKDSACTN